MRIQSNTVRTLELTSLFSVLCRSRLERCCARAKRHTVSSNECCLARHYGGPNAPK